MGPCFWRDSGHTSLPVFANGFHGSHCFSHCGFRFSVLLALKDSGQISRKEVVAYYRSLFRGKFKPVLFVVASLHGFDRVVFGANP